MAREPEHAVQASDVSTIRLRPFAGILGYCVLLALGIQAFLMIRGLGERLFASALIHKPVVAEASGAINANLLHLLTAMVTIILASRVLSAVFRHLRQPPVIGEVLAGIMLGPSLLGAVAPTAYAWLLPQGVATHLGVLAQLGVILYMFLVGVELDTSTLRNKTHATILISHASIGLPFLLGAGAALWLYPGFSNETTPFGVFAMFLGVSMSVTAFPVLARLLTDRGLHRTPLGVVALSCAAVDDVTAWCLLALIVGASQSSMHAVGVAFGGTAVFMALMLVFGRPWMRAILRKHKQAKQLPQSAFAMLCAAILICASVTEYIGIHAVFGAFLLGTLIPHDSAIAGKLKQNLEDIVLVLLLPAFFALTGMRTQLSLVSGAGDWLTCGAIILIACSGKIGGSALAARVSGIGWREALSLGVLMNTRGLMELIVLNIGLELGVLTPKLFAMMVIMALVTTFASEPLLTLLNPERRARAATSDAPLES